MQFPSEITDDLRVRLRRAEGQLRGVQRLVDEGADCKDIVTQLKAVQAALDRAGVRLMISGMRHCLTTPDDPDGTTPSIDEMEDLFLRLR